MDLDKEIKRAIESAKQVTRKDLEEAIYSYAKENSENATYYSVEYLKLQEMIEEDLKIIAKNRKYGANSEYAKGYWQGQYDYLKKLSFNMPICLSVGKDIFAELKKR